MNTKRITSVATLLAFGILLLLGSCSDNTKSAGEEAQEKTVYPSDVITFFDK